MGGQIIVPYWNVSLLSCLSPRLPVYSSDAPSVRPQKDPVLVNLGETADLICVADANPITSGMFTWAFLVSTVMCTNTLSWLPLCDAVHSCCLSPAF